MKMKPLANVEWRKYFSLNNTTLNEYLYNYGDMKKQSNPNEQIHLQNRVR